MNVTLKNQKLVFLMAVAILFVGCSDKRGFKAKTFRVANVLDNKPIAPEGDDHDQSDVSDASQEEITQEQIVKQEEANKTYGESSKGKTTIEYNEAGEEKKLDEVASKDLTEEIQSLAQATAALPADQKLLKGLSLFLDKSKGVAGVSSIELSGLISIDGKDQAFVSGLNVKKGERVVSNAINYTPSKTLDINVSVVADCSKEADGQCVQFAIGVVVQAKDKADQGYLMHFDRQGDGFVLGLGGEALTTFDAALNGEVNTPEQSTYEEPADTTTDTTVDGKTEVPADATASDSSDEKSTEKAADDKAKTDSSVAVAEKAQASATTSSFRQAEQESMKKYEAMKQEKASASAAAKRADLQDKAAERQMKAASTSTSATASGSASSFRQAEQESMKKYEAMKKQEAMTKQENARADLQDKAAERQMKATQTGAQSQKKDRLTKEEATKANTQTRVQGRIDTAHKVEAKTSSTPSFRQAETASMEALNKLRVEQYAQKRAAELKKKTASTEKR